jgi:probable HAF family extracellular repeat protein
MTDLGTLRGSVSLANGINATGQVVGWFAATADFHRQRAFITGPNGMSMTNLGTLGAGDSIASGINASGQVVGRSNTATAAGDVHAFITGPNGVV